MSEEFGPNFITITDEDGNDIELEYVDALEHNGTTYMAFFPTADTEEEAESAQDFGLVILKSVVENGEEGLVHLPLVASLFLGIHLRSLGKVVGVQVHLHLVLHGPVNIHSEQNGEKDHRQHQHRKDGTDDKPRLAPPGLDLPGTAAGTGLFSFLQRILCALFYNIRLVLQILLQAAFLALAIAHNMHLPFFRIFNGIGHKPLKTQYKLYFTILVNSKKETFFFKSFANLM